MQKGSLSRRGFIQRSLAGLAAAGLPAWYAREVFAADEEKAARKKSDSPNERLALGAIGIGSPQSRGLAIMNDALNLKQGVEYFAVCDVDARHRKRAARILNDKHRMEAKQYEDFRRLLDCKEIDAVTIATPDHWHALVAIDALRKGKDVYCEKPLTLTIEEGKAVVKVAQETGRVFQVGSQQRSDKRFRLACELVRNGRIGKVKRVETRIGANPTSPVIPVAKVPNGLNWDFWLGPTPEVPYVYLERGRQAYTRCHYEFRWWYQFSGGKMTDWGAHHNDIAQWGLGMDDSGPVAVEALAQQPSGKPNSYDCHPRFLVTYTYANGRGHDNGILFVGEKDAWIFVNRGTLQASDPKLIEEPLPGDAKRLYVSNNHMGNFIECVRTRKRTICPAEVGHRSVSVCHIGVICTRLGGRPLKWDPAKQVFLDDAEASAMLSRPMRSPWKLEA